MRRMQLHLASEGALVPHRVMVVFGTRPEAIKLAPLILGLQRSEQFEVTTVVTGQHREMLDPVLDLFGIVPDVDLEIMSAGQTLTDITVRTLEGLSPVVEHHLPEVLVVQGDTTAAMVGGLVAFYHRIPVVHLEAGLRTGDIHSPFPEELNRRLIAPMTSLHLAATHGAKDNLLDEGIRPETVAVVGNPVIDALMWAVEEQRPYTDPTLEELDASYRTVVLVTTHRRESWGPKMHAIASAVADIARAKPDVVIVLPMHRNPVVRDVVLPVLSGLDNIWLREPLPYGDFARLLARSDLILTDSGGIQEEAPALGRPVLVLRDTTERPEAIAAGGVKLVGTNRAAIASEALRLLGDSSAYMQMAQPRAVYGDGYAAERCVAAIGHLLGVGARAPEFAGFRPVRAVLSS